MRAKYPVVLLILLLVSGFLFYQRSQAVQRSPFALGVAAAGMRYQELVDAQESGEKLNLVCRPIASGYRLCDADTDGPPGHMLLAVNEKGRIAVLTMRFDDSSYRMRDLTSTMTNGWDEIGPRTTTSAEGAGDVLQWRSVDKRWSVEMVMRETQPTPTWVVMRDDGGIAAAADRSLPALLLLARDGLVGEGVIDAAEKRAPGALLRAADTLTAGARALAQRAAALPLCDPERSLGVLPGTEAREALGEPGATIAEHAVALVFPGKHLVFGESAYLVDSSGQAEQVTLTNLSGDESGARYVFALNFQSRVDAVAQRTKSFSKSDRCRAPAEVVIATIDSTTDAVAAVSHGAVDGEALSSRVTSAVITTTPDDKTAIAIDYVAVYGDDAFAGEVTWWAVMPLDSMKIRTHMPMSLARQDTASRSVRAAFNYAMPEEGDFGPSGDPLDRGSLAGRRLTVEAKRDGRSRTESIVMPSPVGGLQSGWTLLSLF